MLRLAVFDVDSSAGSSTVSPEVDTITFNSEDIGPGGSQATLTGVDQGWKVNQFEVPIELVKFARLGSREASGKTAPADSALNKIVIRVDQANEDDTWCTAVDWVSLSFGAMSPWALVHGTNAQHDTWEFAVRGPSAVQHLQPLGVVFEHLIDLEKNGSADLNALMLQERLSEIAEQFGVRNLHLITHSKGATDSRRMLNAYYWDHLPFRVLSMFSIGTPSKGTILSTTSIVAEEVKGLTNSVPVVGPVSNDPDVAAAMLDAYLANWASLFGLAPVDPARALQTHESMAEFNQQNPKHPAVPYFSIAGAADANGNDIIEFPEAEGMFPPSPESAQRFFGTRIHRVLGRAKSIVVVKREGIDRKNLTTVQYNMAFAVTREEPEDNDLVSTSASTHCTDECGFIPLATFPWNHSALKRPVTLNRILSTIQQLYPLKLGGTVRAR